MTTNPHRTTPPMRGDAGWETSSPPSQPQSPCCAPTPAALPLPSRQQATGPTDTPLTKSVGSLYSHTAHDAPRTARHSFKMSPHRRAVPIFPPLVSQEEIDRSEPMSAEAFVKTLAAVFAAVVCVVFGVEMVISATLGTCAYLCTGSAW